MAESLSKGLSIFKVEALTEGYQLGVRPIKITNENGTFEDTIYIGRGAYGEIFMHHPSKVFVLGKILQPQNRIYMHERVLPQDFPEW